MVPFLTAENVLAAVSPEQAVEAVRDGFVAYALEARGGASRWQHRSGTPLVAVLGSSRLEHVLLQSTSRRGCRR